MLSFILFLFFFNDTATTEIYTLSLTTLFRSQGVASRSSFSTPTIEPTWAVISIACSSNSAWPRTSPRSEEHTSELQSQSNLVCRLLLEKKKTQHFSPQPQYNSRQTTRTNAHV